MICLLELESCIKMDFINLSELTTGYHDRMRRLALLEPLAELERRKVKDEVNRDVDMRGLGLLTLLFFFERRLSRENKTGKKELTNFLFEMTRNTYTFNEKRLEQLAQDLITTFRPSSGKKHSFPFFNWESKEDDTIEFSILKAHDFDEKTQRQFYTLDEDGLELIFATKEFYSEFQISINQLLLKQQIKRGQFHDALRQVREMEIDVNMLQEKMQKMHAEILRSVISEETYERYRTLLEQVYERFEREDEEFKDLYKFVIQTKDTIYKDNMRRDQENTYNLVTQIASELEAVHYEHSRLLQKTNDLRTTALLTAQESLYTTGIKMFNFDYDIVTNILMKPLSPEKMKGVLHPFLRVEQNPIWSPLAVFYEQPIYEEREEGKRNYFEDPTSNAEQEMYRQLLAEKYGEITEKLLTDYQSGKANTLKDWLECIKESHEDWLKARYFYNYWMVIHQYSPISGKDVIEEERDSILQDVYKILGNFTLSVIELPDVVQVHPKYSIQNMQIKIEELTDDLQ